MNLKKLASELKEFEGVSRKKEIKSVVESLRYDDSEYYFDIISDFGDDAAIIGIDEEKAILLAADGIWGNLLEKDPYWAGYCAVLVNANDIAAMGGAPIGMTNIISINDEEVGKEVLRGIKDGVEKFGIPMIGGHTHPDAKCNVLDVSITGIVKKDSVLRSDTAEIGDKVVFAYDLDGKIHEKFDLNWDTTTMKPKKLVRDQLKALEIIGEKKLATACKDISNPGALGTLGMLLEVSKKGAIVDINKIPMNKEVPLNQWLKIYPGCAFVFTAKEENIEKLKEVLKFVNITAEVCGEVIEERKLIVKKDEEEEILFDFNKEYICGC
ncbi:methanogenesis marker 2 protein [Methanococcus aeolicus]|uniref:AIR synthase related protein n=1 Tax=Methanococcus aeolicus (strain ATCC BAA-1280 / DSM 17508 / OCM 812 / Nankai-3) TaxID=419665 RepID=A6UUB0_META3|nr:methanogenesis marker 2 protein [Methanococcus aeolicus]ABR56082.1 AIR synthase related protein [Methanococcus aeolicus Nankai-3]UXM85315.1 methanogenesis marker 2 protein [Methanococcus aeolicus]